MDAPESWPCKWHRWALAATPMPRRPRVFDRWREAQNEPKASKAIALELERTMSDEDSTKSGPDLTQGVRVAGLGDGQMLTGHVGEDAVLLVRRGDEFFAIGALCTHYHAPLAGGIVAGDTIRCPLHHACFSLRTGEALRAPAISPAGCWDVARIGEQVFVRTRKPTVTPSRFAHQDRGSPPKRVVLVGGGAAGFAAAEMLRREGFEGSIVMLSEEASPPLDRPNLSKDFLAGSAPEEWLPLTSADFYGEHKIDLRIDLKAVKIDLKAHAVALAGGGSVAFDRLLLATGAEPNRLSFPGSNSPQVYTLRSLSDCRAIIARAASARHAVVIGSSFIGLEVAASLRARAIEVDVIAPEARPMERILGTQIGDFLRRLHEQHGVRFHLQQTVKSIEGNRVTLSGGEELDAELVVMGVGVRPRTDLAESAGLKLDRGVLVDSYLETSAAGVFAAGDIARWPDSYSGKQIRVEHWVVAQRQGQTAARNMLGKREKFDAVPFFWSQHYDVAINYVGHAESWDELQVEGDIEARNCLIRYKHQGRLLAVASICRDVESLKAEFAMEGEALTA